MIGDVIHISPIAITNVIMYYEGRVIGDLYLVKKTVQLQFANHNYTKYHAFERRTSGDLYFIEETLAENKCI